MSPFDRIIDRALAFLSAKLDSITRAIPKIDLSALEEKLADVQQAIEAKPVAEFVTTPLEEKLDAVKEAIEAIPTVEFDTSALEKAVSELDFTIPEQNHAPTIEAIEKQTGELVTELQKHKDIDLGSVLNALASLSKAVKEIPQPEISVETIDVTPVVDAQKEVVKSITKLGKILSEKTTEAIEEKLDLLRTTVEQIQFPKTFLLDDAQFRALKANGGRTIVTGGGEALLARNVTMANVALTLANTEYSYVFPANTLSWQLKLRDQGVLTYYSFITGKLPTSGDGSLYTTVPQNFVRSQSGVEWSGKTIYLGAESNGQTVELEVFTA